MAKDNQNVKETKMTLADHLKNVGLNDDTAFKKARTAYNAMWGTKRIKADLNRWHDIGRFFYDAKVSMAEAKINMNSGHLTKIRTTYFKEMTAQDFSNAVWLHEHFPEVKLWIETNKRNLSNPASIKQAIRKSLKDRSASGEKVNKSEYKSFGFSVPVSNPNPVGSTGPEDTTSNTAPLDTKVTIDDRLKNFELLTNQLIKTKRNEWSLERFKRFETTFTVLGDYLEEMADSLQKAGTIVQVNDDIFKKKKVA